MTFAWSAQAQCAALLVLGVCQTPLSSSMPGGDGQTLWTKLDALVTAFARAKNGLRTRMSRVDMKFEFKSKIEDANEHGRENEILRTFEDLGREVDMEPRTSHHTTSTERILRHQQTMTLFAIAMCWINEVEIAKVAGDLV